MEPVREQGVRGSEGGVSSVGRRPALALAEPLGSVDTRRRQQAGNVTVV